MEGTSGSDSSAIHSSPDTGSFSQVTRTHRSESMKRQRPAIEDAERESRPVGRERGSSSRNQRSTSAPKPGRSTAVRRTNEKARSSGGSPTDKRKLATADEELEAKLREMEDQGAHMRYQIQKVEDDNNAQRIAHSSIMQSIKDECSEFDHQYNHVLSCWRQAEERSRTFEMELRSEVRLFQEAREYLGEMQQQFGHAMQEDHGAGLRIQELEILLERERMQLQAHATSFNQDEGRVC